MLIRYLFYGFWFLPASLLALLLFHKGTVACFYCSIERIWTSNTKRTNVLGNWPFSMTKSASNWKLSVIHPIVLRNFWISRDNTNEKLASVRLMSEKNIEETIFLLFTCKVYLHHIGIFLHINLHKGIWATNALFGNAKVRGIHQNIRCKGRIT